jgi:2-oxoglutarate ferredoxin oxidoreductase subunit beta
LEHKGFAFIEVMVQCPTQAGRYMHGSADPARLLSLIKEASLKKAAAEKMSAAELEGRFVVGTLHQEQGRPELSQTLQQMIAKAEA